MKRVNAVLRNSVHPFCMTLSTLESESDIKSPVLASDS